MFLCKEIECRQRIYVQEYSFEVLKVLQDIQYIHIANFLAFHDISSFPPWKCNIWSIDPYSDLGGISCFHSSLQYQVDAEINMSWFVISMNTVVLFFSA